MHAVWLVDTIKQLAVQLPLKGQYYGEMGNNINTFKLHLPSRPVRVTMGKLIGSANENNSLLKKVRLQEDIPRKERVAAAYKG